MRMGRDDTLMIKLLISFGGMLVPAYESNTVMTAISEHVTP